MFRRVFRVQTYHWAGIIPFFEYRDPYDDTEPKYRKPPETGWERVRALFEYTEHGYASEEYVATVQLASASFVLAAVVSAGMESIQSFDRFVTTNQQTKFVSAYEARRKMQDFVILEGIKKGLKYGIKCGTFTAIMGLVSIVVAAYRGHQGILEYAVGAGVAGAIVRLPVGFAASAVGLGVGSFLGAIIGSVIWGIGILSGSTVKDTQKMLYNNKVNRDRNYNNMLKAYKDEAQESPWVKKWLKNKMQTFSEHTLADEDKRYIVQPLITDDAQNASNEDGVKHEGAAEIPVTMDEVKIPLGEKSESSK